MKDEIVKSMAFLIVIISVLMVLGVIAFVLFIAFIARRLTISIKKRRRKKNVEW
jgi:preprotein translocase subunit SecY